MIRERLPFFGDRACVPRQQLRRTITLLTYFSIHAMRLTKRKTERGRGKSTRSVLRKRNRARINLEWLRFRARLERPESNDRGAAGLRYLLRHKLAHGTESESRNFIRGRVRDLYVSSGLSIAAAATAYSTSDV